MKADDGLYSAFLFLWLLGPAYQADQSRRKFFDIY